MHYLQRQFRRIYPLFFLKGCFGYRQLRGAAALVALLAAGWPLTAQVTIWEEDFSGANQGWTQSFTDCDGTPGSFAGVQNGRFEVIDMEGAPCCSVGGGNENEWVIDELNIDDYCNVAISVDYGFVGSFECIAGGPYFGCSGDPSIENGHDQIVFEYSIDGGPWVQFAYVCGGQAGTATITGLNGSTLLLRIRPANKAVAETYWFDNVLITGSQASVDQPADVVVCPGLPVNVTFTGSNGATFAWTNDNTAIGLAASGTGNISFVAAMVSSQEVGTLTVTPVSGGCSGPSVTFTITVNPQPAVDDPADLQVCSGAPVDIVFTGTGVNPDYNWTNTNTAIGLGASGTGDISFTAANVGAPVTGTITVTPVENGCTGMAQSFTVTVRPLPTANTPPDLTVCGDAPVNIALSGSSGATLNWTNDNTAIGLGASGTGTINFISANVGGTETATITITPSLNGCDGDPVTFTLTVNPLPTVNNPGNQAFCAGEQVLIQLSGSNNPTFNWTNSNTQIGLPASGSGDIDFIAPLVSIVQTGTISIIPVAGACTGPSANFDITITPLPEVDQPADITVCAGETVDIPLNGTPGASLDWTNDNTAIGLSSGGSGDIFFVAANVATVQVATIIITPELNGCAGDPVFFSITVDPGPQISNPGNQVLCAGDSLTLAFPPFLSWTNSDTAIGLPAGGTGDIRFAAADTTVPITSTITVSGPAGGCGYQPVSFTITVLPRAAGVPGDQSFCAGDSVRLILSDTSGTVYNWTNSNPAIGLGASGVDSIVFVAANTLFPISGTITVITENGACPSDTQSFVITITPPPFVFPPGFFTACNGSPIAVNFNGTPGADFTWTNNNPDIGLPASGSGNLSFTGMAPDSTEQALVTVTPVLGSCAGNPVTFSIVVNPLPVMDPPSDVISCGMQTVTVDFTGTPGANYTWTNNNPGIGLPGSGSGDISFLAGNTPDFATIIVTPSLGGCVGPSENFIIRIISAPVADNPGDAAVCAGDSLSISFTGTSGATYMWTNDNPDIGLPGSGSGPIAFLAPGADTLQVAQLTVTPQLGSCTGPAQTFVITVNPFVTANIAGPDTLCQGENAQFLAEGGIFFLWSTGDTSSTLQFPADTSRVISVTVTSLAGCAGIDSLALFVHPADSLIQLAASCNPADTGTLVVTLSNQFGCDSVVTRITSLLPGDSLILTATTCDPALAGTFTDVFSNQYGCDSVVTTIRNLSPTDTLLLNAFTCNPANAGTFTTVLSNQFGCDSVVISNIVYDPLAIDTTILISSTCDPAMAGINVSLLTGTDGCDSVVISDVALLPSDTTLLSASSCDPAAVGTFTAVFSNQFGCDSVVVTTVGLLPSDTTLLSASSCDPAAVGTFTTVFSNQFGCDSTVVTTVGLLPSDSTVLSATTCDPAAAGIFTLVFSNQYGCDSTVITTVGLLPTDTTQLIAFTCDPAAAGVFSTTLSNQFGCDSLVVTTVLLDPVQCVLDVAASVLEPDCHGNSTGVLTLDILNGTAPYNYSWSGSNGDSGNGQSPASPLQITGLPAGSYSITISEANGFLTNTIDLQIDEPAPLVLQIDSISDYNGFPIRCAGAADGRVAAGAAGGTPAYQFAWSDGSAGPVGSDLAAGDYQLTVTDQRGCTASTGISLAAPPPLALALRVERTDCGDTLADITILPDGGIAPYTVLLDGNLVAGTMPSVGSGAHVLELVDGNGCRLDTLLQLLLPPVPEITLPADTVVLPGEPLSILAQTNVQTWSSLVWQPLPDSLCPNCLLQRWAPLQSQRYTVTITDTFGCSASASMLVVVDKTPQLYIPNAFSPNEDGNNDRFQAGAGPGVGDLELVRIFDRWGNLLYEWDAPVPVNDWPGWDGRFRGKKAEQGVYVYYMRVRMLDGSLLERKGDLTLILH